MSFPDHLTPRRHPDTAFRVFEGEAVLISPAQNMVRMLNVTGSRIWELLDGERTIADIAAILSGEFDVSTAHALSSVRTFLQELAERQLVLLEP